MTFFFCSFVFFTVQLYYNSKIHCISVFEILILIITETHSHKLERVESTLKSRYKSTKIYIFYSVQFGLLM